MDARVPESIYTKVFSHLPTPQPVALVDRIFQYEAQEQEGLRMSDHDGIGSGLSRLEHELSFPSAIFERSCCSPSC